MASCVKQGQWCAPAEWGGAGIQWLYKGWGRLQRGWKITVSFQCLLRSELWFDCWHQKRKSHPKPLAPEPGRSLSCRDAREKDSREWRPGPGRTGKRPIASWFRAGMKQGEGKAVGFPRGMKYPKYSLHGYFPIQGFGILFSACKTLWGGKTGLAYKH